MLNDLTFLIVVIILVTNRMIIIKLITKYIFIPTREK